MVSLKVRTAFEYQAVVFGFSFRDLERSCVQRVTIGRPSRTGVVHTRRSACPYTGRHSRAAAAVPSETP